MESTLTKWNVAMPDTFRDCWILGDVSTAIAIRVAQTGCQQHLHCATLPDRMNFVPLIAAVALAFALPSAQGALPRQRKIACKTASNAASCYWTRGRLGFYMGTPAFRVWKIRTHRLLGVYSGPSVDRYGLDNETPEFPLNIERVFEPDMTRIFADFEVCLLEAEKPHTMQAVCIEAAKNVFVEKLQ